MIRNIVELVAKFRDEASVGLRRLATEANRTMQIQSRAASSSGRQQQLMHAAAARLGIRTEREIRREIQRTQAAYNAMAKSGRASHNELARAAQQTRSRIRELNAEMNSGSRFNRMIQGGKSLARGAASVAAGAAAGAYVLAQPVSRTMDYDTELRHATNTMYAGKTLAEKRAGMAEINKTVNDAAYLGGTSKQAALQAMNTMVASGSLSDAAVKQMLPTVMKTAAAAGADADDIANIVTRAKQAGFKEADIPALLDRAMQSGADGGFELKDMARWLPQQLAAMKSAGMGATLDNFSSLLNANQLAFMTAGSTDEAGNNLVNLLAKISSQDIVTKAKKIDINGQEGFDFTDKMNERQAAGMNSLDALVDIVSEIVSKDKKSAALMKQMAAAQGDEAKLALLENQKALVDGTAVGRLVSDRQALMALLSLINNKQEAARLQQGQANAAGAVDNNYQFVAEGSGFKKEQLKTAYSEAEYGAFSSFTDKVADKLKGIADWARGHQEAAQTAVAAGQGAAAVSATAGTSSMVSGGWRFFQGGQGVAGAGRFLPSAGSMGAFTLGAAPLAAMGGVTHLAAQRDKYDDWSKPLAAFADRLQSFLPDFMSSAKNEYMRKREELGGNNSPLDSPVLKESMAQLSQSAQTNQQASQQYVTAATENQAATVQLTNAASQMTAAAAQMQAAAGKPIPVTVTVQNGNIMAYINQAAARAAAKN
ncbi:phage tail tape measure protein [Neisseria sp. Marseille-Q1983]|uniref:phage tail tape measure protein n=1 Tax=Neisseria sp. Marseille-Q1983 TaxID=2830768 RepID=UPI001BADC687|nr:phage tail tape measure protein [Neisseria sp. Marseille-Q1983]